MPPSSSEELLPDAEKEREAAVVVEVKVLRSVEDVDDGDASICASGALEAATAAALLRLPKSAFIVTVLGGVGGGLDAGNRTGEQEVLQGFFSVPFDAKEEK